MTFNASQLMTVSCIRAWLARFRAVDGPDQPENNKAKTPGVRDQASCKDWFCGASFVAKSLRFDGEAACSPLLDVRWERAIDHRTTALLKAAAGPYKRERRRAVATGVVNRQKHEKLSAKPGWPLLSIKQPARPVVVLTVWPKRLSRLVSDSGTQT